MYLTPRNCTGIPGVTVILRDSAGNTQTDMTDGDGYYLFDNLPAGAYTVEVDTATLPAGVNQIFDFDGIAGSPDMSDYSLSNGENDRQQDFGYVPGGPTAATLATSQATPSGNNYLSVVTALLVLFSGVILWRRRGLCCLRSGR